MVLWHALLKRGIIGKAAVFQYLCRPVKRISDKLRRMRIAPYGDGFTAQRPVAP